jgi:hypothetical protein
MIGEIFRKKNNGDTGRVSEYLKKINLLDWHRSIATRQRASYNTMKSNFPKDSIFIELDYKQKVNIGLSPRQPSEEYYNQKQRSILGFGIYHWVEDEIKCQNVDIISDILDQTAFSVISCFK